MQKIIVYFLFKYLQRFFRLEALNIYRIIKYRMQFLISFIYYKKIIKTTLENLK